MLLSILTSLAARGSVQANNTTDVCVNGSLAYAPDSIRVVVGVTCILSMIGALLIIFSYILIRDIRTKAREILVNLSLMDFMAAAANFFGVVTNFSQSENHSVEGYVCQIQASFAMYGTLSSVLWTICVAVYVFFRIMLENSKVAQRSVYGFYVICYGLPLIMTLWFSLTEKLGGSGGDGDTYGGSGWCSLKINGKHGADTFNVVIGNDIWIYLTIILVPLIFISLHFYLRYQVCTYGGLFSINIFSFYYFIIYLQVKAGKTILTQNLSSAVQSVERKLMLIPIIFILLRIWSLLLVIIKVEMDIPLGCVAILFFLHIAVNMLAFLNLRKNFIPVLLHV